MLVAMRRFNIHSGQPSALLFATRDDFNDFEYRKDKFGGTLETIPYSVFLLED